MKRANVIIGAAFGDEGKGLMTDYLVRQNDAAETTVVRFNGGANAGHTVVTPDGQRHVFHHFGSGTLAGAKTFLSRFFLVNPVLWRPEYEELLRRRCAPRIFVDRMAPLTTVYDMLLNQAIENQRGEHRHGSCGSGVHQTMLRQQDHRLSLCAVALTRPAYLRDKVNMIRKQYAALLPDFQSEEIFERFLKDCTLMANHVEFRDSRHLAVAGNIVFEGAQGLLLDAENKMFFPHVTHSRTGLANVIPLAMDADIDHLDVTYVMRSYLTRHGAGELPGEQQHLKLHDDTNVDNPWQGALRFAPLDADLIQDAILDDLEDTSVTPNIAVTHVDQCELDLDPWHNFPVPVGYFSSGPSHQFVFETSLKKVRKAKQKSSIDNADRR